MITVKISNGELEFEDRLTRRIVCDITGFYSTHLKRDDLAMNSIVEYLGRKAIIDGKEVKFDMDFINNMLGLDFELVSTAVNKMINNRLDPTAKKK